jgi:hypothetical protein
MPHCTNCGTDFTGQFCPNCGTAAPVSGPVAPNNGAYTPPPANAQRPIYNNISVVQPTNVTSPMGWIGWMLLCSCLPLLGQIIMLLAANDQSAKNFAKAQLILVAVITVISLIVVILMFMFGALAIGAANQ